MAPPTGNRRAFSVSHRSASSSSFTLRPRFNSTSHNGSSGSSSRSYNEGKSSSRPVPANDRRFVKRSTYKHSGKAHYEGQEQDEDYYDETCTEEDAEEENYSYGDNIQRARPQYYDDASMDDTEEMGKRGEPYEQNAAEERQRREKDEIEQQLITRELQNIDRNLNLASSTVVKLLQCCKNYKNNVKIIHSSVQTWKRFFNSFDEMPKNYEVERTSDTSEHGDGNKNHDKSEYKIAEGDAGDVDQSVDEDQIQQYVTSTGLLMETPFQSRTGQGVHDLSFDSENGDIPTPVFRTCVAKTPRNIIKRARTDHGSKPVVTTEPNAAEGDESGEEGQTADIETGTTVKKEREEEKDQTRSAAEDGLDESGHLSISTASMLRTPYLKASKHHKEYETKLSPEESLSSPSRSGCTSIRTPLMKAAMSPIASDGARETLDNFKGDQSTRAATQMYDGQQQQKGRPLDDSMDIPRSPDLPQFSTASLLPIDVQKDDAKAESESGESHGYCDDSSGAESHDEDLDDFLPPSERRASISLRRKYAFLEEGDVGGESSEAETGIPSKVQAGDVDKSTRKRRRRARDSLTLSMYSSRKGKAVDGTRSPSMSPREDEDSFNIDEEETLAILQKYDLNLSRHGEEEQQQGAKKGPEPSSNPKDISKSIDRRYDMRTQEASSNKSPVVSRNGRKDSLSPSTPNFRSPLLSTKLTSVSRGTPISNRLAGSALELGSLEQETLISRLEEEEDKPTPKFDLSNMPPIFQSGPGAIQITSLYSRFFAEGGKKHAMSLAQLVDALPELSCQKLEVLLETLVAKRVLRPLAVGGELYWQPL